MLRRPPYDDFMPDYDDDDDFEEEEYQRSGSSFRPVLADIPPHLVWSDPATGIEYHLFTRAIDKWEFIVQSMEENIVWH